MSDLTGNSVFAAANTAHFTLSLEGQAHDLQVLEFQGREALSTPYAFDLELVSEHPDLDLESFLHRPAFLAFSHAGGGVHGLVRRIAQGESGKRLTRYRMTLVPQLAYLAYRINQRIFQHLSVPQIVAQVLEEHGILAGAYRFGLSASYPERLYCTQYDESDLHFVQRLCEEEGIHYHFEHSAAGHVLVFGDDQTVFPRRAPVAYQQDSGLVADQPVIKRFDVRLETRTARVTRRDYDFEKPRLLLESEARSDAQPDLEDYDYPGRFVDRSRGKHLAKRALERHRADYQLAEGDSDQPTLSSGHFLALAAHPRSAWNQLWLLDEVLHEGKQPQVLEESIHQDQAEGFTQGYRNHFSALPWDVPYRPPLNHPKPRILGSQSAVVTGPPGEEIHCDEYGRVKVQFFWDRHGQADDRTSCWLRVSSSWAGDRYGGIAIPRVGMEVLVSFLEGDPDQPLISGCLYHKEHVVPYALPANKTRSVFKTLSSPGGAGYNELRIEDRKGQEQIYLHAQRDWDENIEHDQRIRIGHERHDTVEANSYTELKAEEHRTTHADRRVVVRADDHLGIGGSQHVRIGNGQFVEAGQEIHLGSGFKVVLEAGSELTLKGGGSWIKLDASGICINGATVKMNSGGAPGQGAGIRIHGPLLPGAAVSQAGEVLSKPLSNALATVPFSSPVAEEEEEEEELEEGGITLRIGVFFDGTGNNRSNSESVAGCHAKDENLQDAAEDIRRFCAAYGYDGLGRSPNNSYGNDLTNVARLYDLYVDQADESIASDVRQVFLKVYLEGVGTSSASDDSVYSQATGLGRTGVLARVEQAPASILIGLDRFRTNNPSLLIRRIEFDIFGFSRGAAAARHFANDLLKGPGSLLAASFPADSPMLAPGFAWQPKVDFGIAFVGLFDTVAGILDPLHGDLTPANALNPGLNLRLAAGDIGKIVQFVARDEHRYNFALVRTDNDIVLPGAHSDIGGGYLPWARETLLLTKPRLSTEKSYVANERAKAYLDTRRALDADLLQLQRYGLELEIVNWAVNSENNYRKAWHQEEKRVYAAVRSDRQVAGELSLVYLRAMREVAAREGAPFNVIDPSDNRMALPPMLEAIAAKVLAAVLTGAAVGLTESEEALLFRRYIHLSAHWNASLGIVFANRPTDSGIRAEYPNE